MGRLCVSKISEKTEQSGRVSANWIVIRENSIQKPNCYEKVH